MNLNWRKRGERAFGASLSAGDQAQLEAFVLPTDGGQKAGARRE